jgi:transposase
LPRARIASDLGVGKSTLSKWISVYRPTDLGVAPSVDLAKENERLRLENRILKEAEAAQRILEMGEHRREILKKAVQFFASQKL